MTTILGIDPGLDGAVGAISLDYRDLLSVDETPTLLIRSGKSSKRAYSVPGMLAILAKHAGDVYVVIEESQAMPGQGVRSMHTIGYGFGLWIGMLAALKMPYTRVRPAAWKRAMGLSKDKEQSRQRAQELFPTAPLARKKDHGMAEALLLAWYCASTFTMRGVDDARLEA